MTGIYWVLLFLVSAHAKVVKEIDIIDNQLGLKILQKPVEALHRKHSQEEILSNSLDDFTKTDIKEIPDVEKKPEEEYKIDNGTALLLTPYIEEGNIQEAQRLCKVNPDLFLGINSYSGFLTVNKTYNSNLFFWYFPGERGPDTPWIIWLQGGPGQSSTYGLFLEIGPFSVEDSNGTLKLNEHSWLRNHSLVFIDNPVGTGYSFTDHKDGFALDMATYGSHLHSATRQLVQLFPELQAAPLFVAGESYAGKYVPALAAEIHWGRAELPRINLQGIIVGNGYSDPYQIRDLPRNFYNFGTLGAEEVEQMQPLVLGLQQEIAAGDSLRAKRIYSSLIASILAFTKQSHAYNVLQERLPEVKHTYLLDQSDIKRAIHVGDIEFSSVNMTVNTKLIGDFLSSANYLYEMLLEHYDVLAYCGQLDQILPCAVESENFRRWRWPGADHFRRAPRGALRLHGRLAGYYKSGGRFTEALIMGAGHMAPLDAPAPVRHLVTSWVHRHARDPLLPPQTASKQTSHDDENKV